jgi:hypothetical protein
MHRVVLAWVLAFALAAPQPAGARSSGRHFVGFTAASFDGGQGVRIYTEACQAAFSASARMCTSIEVLDTVAWPTVPNTTRGWVRPVFQALDEGLVDASGVQAASPTSGALSCIGWSSSAPSVHGLAVSGDGRFATPGSFDSCDTPRPIACCALSP